MSGHRPLVFAHRGGADARPEHTLAAYLQALEDGVDGLEADVRMTRDGHLVCVHDPKLHRTSNGRGRVSAKTLDELDALDYGSWHPSAPEPDLTKLLTLDRLLQALRERDRPVRLLIETKHPSRYGAEVERKLVRLLREHGLVEPRPDSPVRVTVMSFSALALRRMRILAPRVPTVFLLHVLPPLVKRGRLPFAAHVAGPRLGLLRSKPGLVQALRAGGFQVYVWTVNAEEELDFVLSQKVDGVITDRPKFVLDHVPKV
ncbi:glycerophosphodiester phosphodiesterase family protein [Actinoplanes sp. NPDC051633]|uniref:glycerophosphodiester phosphodiesterase n=1 Tax=Actinoplanes sp. NPDC051633 TaxID=3155670 RepID=UPI00342D37F2